MYYALFLLLNWTSFFAFIVVSQESFVLCCCCIYLWPIGVRLFLSFLLNALTPCSQIKYFHRSIIAKCTNEHLYPEIIKHGQCFYIIHNCHVNSVLANKMCHAGMSLATSLLCVTALSCLLIAALPHLLSLLFHLMLIKYTYSKCTYTAPCSNP